VGSSDGEHDDGRGEVDDLSHAAVWLRDLEPDPPLVVVGYSFGAVCALRHALRHEQTAGVVAIGLPVRLYPVDEIDALRQPLGIVQGSRDEFGSPDEIRARVLNARRTVDLRVIDGATHFFPGATDQAAEAVVAVAEDLLARIESG
jgi:alpha/beta superfamily hydrolase